MTPETDATAMDTMRTRSVTQLEARRMGTSSAAQQSAGASSISLHHNSLNVASLQRQCLQNNVLGEKKLYSAGGSQITLHDKYLQMRVGVCSLGPAQCVIGQIRASHAADAGEDDA